MVGVLQENTNSWEFTKAGDGTCQACVSCADAVMKPLNICSQIVFCYWLIWKSSKYFNDQTKREEAASWIVSSRGGMKPRN